jgi:quercetin dioxygenase-like cupin family protein
MAMTKRVVVLILAVMAAMAWGPAAAQAAKVLAKAASEVPAVPYDSGSSYRLLVPGEATGGQYAVIELVEGPGYRTPWHRHDGMEERYYVAEGTLTVHSAEGTREYPAGSIITIPPGAVHAQGNASQAPVKLLLTLTPGGFEQFFIDRAALYETTKRDDPGFQEKMIELAGRQGRWLQPADPPAGATAAP